MLSPQLEAQALEAIERYLLQANHYFRTSFPLPTLSFKLRGKCAGKAYLAQWQIRLNPILYRENQAQFLSEVIPHELAHLLVYKLFGPTKPHGVEWRSMMRELFQLTPKTTHNFNLASVQSTRFLYRCDCQAHQLTIRRHNKVLRGQAEYRCTRCQHTLKFMG